MRRQWFGVLPGVRRSGLYIKPTPIFTQKQAAPKTRKLGTGLSIMCAFRSYSSGRAGAVTSETAAAALRAELQVITPIGGDDADDATSIARSSGVTNDGAGDVATGTTAVPLAKEVRDLPLATGSSPMTRLCCSDETKQDDSAGSVRLAAP